MYHARIFECTKCKETIEASHPDEHYSKCYCGGQLVMIGETYDEEFARDEQDRYSYFD